MKEKNKDIKKEKEFKLLKNGEQPSDKTYEGTEIHRGRRNKSFFVYLKGEGENDKLELIKIPVVTPKNSVMVKYILKTRGLEDIENDDIIDVLSNMINERYGVPNVTIEKLTMNSLIYLIKFIAFISETPSENSRNEE